MKQNKTIWKATSLFTLIFLTAISCKKECEMEVEKIILKNAEHVISYECDGDRIRFFIDAIGDESFGYNGEWPDIDIYRLFVDYNRNGKVDEGIDLLFGFKKPQSVCTARLITATSTKPCTDEPGVGGSFSFGLIGDHTTKHHVHFIVGVPKSLLSNGSSAHVVFHVYDSENGWDYYPSNEPLFTDYFEIDW